MCATKAAEHIYTRVRDKLEAELQPRRLVIRDDSGKHQGHSGYNPQGASHLHIHVVTTAFDGMSRVNRYRWIYQLLDHELRTHVHALELDLKTPAEADE